MSTKSLRNMVLNKNKIYCTFMLLTLALGVFFRLYKFNTIPYGLNHDAARYGLVAIELWEKLPRYTPYYPAWVDETMYSYYLGIFFKIFIISPWTLKLAASLVGVAALVSFYFIAGRLQNKITKFFSLFFFAISGWHIVMSRVGWSAMLVPLFQPITLGLLLLAVQRNPRNNNKALWLVAGLMLGITLYSYGGARATPVIVVVWLYILASSLKKQHRYFINLLIYCVSALVVFLPMLDFALNQWGIYSGRMRFLSVGNEITRTNSFQPLYDNILTSAKMLHVRANGADFFVDEPLLEFIPGLLFMVGLVALILAVNDKKSALILSWFLLGFVPGILSIPNGNHDIGLMVPTYLIIGEGCFALFILGKRVIKKTFYIKTALALMLLVATYDMYQQYFSSQRREIWSFYPETTEVANFMNNNREQYDFFLTDNYPRDALTFITYSGGDPWINHYKWFEENEDLLSVNINSDKGQMFLMFDIPQNNYVRKSLLEKYPGSYVYNLIYENDNIKRRVASSVVVVPLVTNVCK